MSTSPFYLHVGLHSFSSPHAVHTPWPVCYMATGLFSYFSCSGSSGCSIPSSSRDGETWASCRTPGAGETTCAGRCSADLASGETSSTGETYCPFGLRPLWAGFWGPSYKNSTLPLGFGGGSFGSGTSAGKCDRALARACRAASPDWRVCSNTAASASFKLFTSKGMLNAQTVGRAFAPAAHVFDAAAFAFGLAAWPLKCPCLWASLVHRPRDLPTAGHCCHSPSWAHSASQLPSSSHSCFHSPVLGSLTSFAFSFVATLCLSLLCRSDLWTYHLFYFLSFLWVFPCFGVVPWAFTGSALCVWASVVLGPTLRSALCVWASVVLGPTLRCFVSCLSTVVTCTKELGGFAFGTKSLVANTWNIHRVSKKIPVCQRTGGWLLPLLVGSHCIEPLFDGLGQHLQLLLLWVDYCFQHGTLPRSCIRVVPPGQSPPGLQPACATVHYDGKRFLQPDHL